MELTKKQLSDYAWEEIIHAAETGKARDLFSVGDETFLPLSTGQKIPVVIVGFNHDTTVGGDSAAITFMTKQVSDQQYPMASSDSSAFTENLVRTVTLPAIYNNILPELRGSIKQVRKKALFSFDAPQSFVTTDDYLFLLDWAEISDFSRIGSSVQQYEYFKGAEYKQLLKSGTEFAEYWLRTFNAQGWYSFIAPYCRKGEWQPGVAIDSPIHSKGIVFGFCI